MALAAVAGCAEGGEGMRPTADAASLSGTVARVIDGDTVRVRAGGEETAVRLIGIDTPEVARPDTPVQCFGPEASRRAEALLPEGTRVRVVTDPGQDARDRFGRLLGYVYVAGAGGAEGSVNYRLVREGYARRYVYMRDPFRYADAFGAAERRARRDGAGLWGPPCRGRR